MGVINSKCEFFAHSSLQFWIFNKSLLNSILTVGNHDLQEMLFGVYILPDLSISIINTNNCEMTLQCLRSVYQGINHFDMEIIVIDNASTDGSADTITKEFPEVKLIRNRTKLGFSSNNNQAILKTSGRYIMLLNDDTIALGDAFNEIISFMDEHPEVGVVGANLLNPDHTDQEDSYYPPRPLYDAFRPLSTWINPLVCDPDLPTLVGGVCGACMVVRREVIEQVGLLDTDFDPIYSEEVEWCHRIRQDGWLIYHLPKAKVIHYGSQTMDRMPLYKMAILYEKKALYYRKHYPVFTVWEFKLALLISSVVKLLCWFTLYPFKRQTAKQKILGHWYIAKRSLFF